MEDKKPTTSPLFLAAWGSQFPIVGVLVQLCLAVLMAVKWKIDYCDILFSIGYSLYLMLANKYRFQCNLVARQMAAAAAAVKKNDHKNGGDDDDNDEKTTTGIDLHLIPDDSEPWFACYMANAAIVGIFLPLGTILLLPSKDDDDSDDNDDLTTTTKIIAAPLFLLWCQIIMETIALQNIYYHDLIRIMVPIGFNAYRMQSLMVWCTVSWNKTSMLLSLSSNNGDHDNGENVLWWSYWCTGLAVANLILWTYNLFGFLLLRMTPYFIHPERSPSPEVEWKGYLIPIPKKKEGEKGTGGGSNNKKLD